MTPERLWAPTKQGTISIEPSKGRCQVAGCGVKGGGLLRVTIEEPILEGVTWEKPVVLCGGCLATVLIASFTKAE